MCRRFNPVSDHHFFFSNSRIKRLDRHFQPSENAVVKIHYLGHASAVVMSRKTRILIDPWFSPDLSGGVLHPVPPVQKLTEDEIGQLDGIHVSHMHADHFCKQTLACLPKTLPVLIAKHKDGVFAAAIRALGFETIIEIEDGPRGIQFGDLQLSVFLPSRAYPYDSSLIVTFNGDSYLFDNDARFNDSHYYLLGQYFPRFQGVLVGYADCYPFPLIFDFSGCRDFHRGSVDEGFLQLAIDQSWRRIEGICERLRPTWIFPYAAGLRFPHRDLAKYNQMFSPASEILNRKLHGARPVSIKYGEIVEGASGPVAARLEDWNQQDNPSIVVLPNVEGEVDTDSIFLASNELAESYRKLLKSESKSWVSKMTVRMEVLNFKGGAASWDSLPSDAILSFNFLFDGQDVRKINDGEMPEIDLVVRYSPFVIQKVLSGAWSYRRAHYSYRCAVKVNRIVPGQIAVHRWGTDH